MNLGNEKILLVNGNFSYFLFIFGALGHRMLISAHRTVSVTLKVDEST